MIFHAQFDQHQPGIVSGYVSEADAFALEQSFQRIEEQMRLNHEVEDSGEPVA